MSTLTANVKTRVDVLGFCVEVRRCAQHSGLDARRTGELLLVVSELGTNAALHGKGGALTVVVTHTGWQVSAVDAGPGFTPAVLADAGRSDRLGRDGVRQPSDGGRSFGSGLATVRRLSTSFTLQNAPRGAQAFAARDFSNSQGAVR